MCRLVLVSMRGKPLSKGTSLLDVAIDAFIKSAENDPYLSRLTKGGAFAHGDGWGLAALAAHGESITPVYYKSINPVFTEESVRRLRSLAERISEYDEVYLAIHARRASKGEPIGTRFSHPFMYISSRGVVFFSHNGGVDKERIARRLGLNPWIHVDSELLGRLVARIVFECLGERGDPDRCIALAYEEAKQYVLPGSALNTTLLLLWDGKVYSYITHRVESPSDDERKQYFTILAHSLQNFTVTGSITIWSYLSQEDLSKPIILEPGVYRVQPGSIIKILEL